MRYTIHYNHRVYSICGDANTGEGKGKNPKGKVGEFERCEVHNKKESNLN